MKKILITLICLVLGSLAFAQEFQIDIFGGFSCGLISSQGTANYKIDNPDQIQFNSAPYSSDISYLGAPTGIDVYLESQHYGIYCRIGPVFAISSDRTTTERRTIFFNDPVNYLDSESSVANVLDLGMTYKIAPVSIFEINAAAALSLINLEGNLIDYYPSGDQVVTDFESFLGFGATADIYTKFKIDNFFISTGIQGSFYPLTSLSSYDSNVKYDKKIRNCMAYGTKIYLAIGYSFDGIAADY